VDSSEVKKTKKQIIDIFDSVPKAWEDQELKNLKDSALEGLKWIQDSAFTKVLSEEKDPGQVLKLFSNA